MEKHKRYIDIGWWDSIQHRDLDNWKNNFGATENIAKFILDNVIFYNKEQLKSYTRVLINKLKERVYSLALRENDYAYIEENVLNQRWNTFLSETCFIPAASHSDPAASAHEVLRYWRDELKINEDALTSLEDIEDKYKQGFHRFILVDDFSGSGEQMKNVLKQKIVFEGKDIEIGKLSEQMQDIEIIIAVYVIHENAQRRLLEDFAVEILFVDYINDSFNFLNKDALFYEGQEGNLVKEIINNIYKFREEIMQDNETLKKLSKYELNIPIVFEHGCPNNTLLLLFAQTKNWQQLFKRGE